MRLLLINQFGLDSGAPTGRILAELGQELEKRGHTVHLLISDSSYGKPRRGVKRMLGEGLSHLILFCRSLGYRRVDAVISLTTPACLAVTAGVIAGLHRAKHFHWIMDVYPEVGVRLGELREGALVRFLSALMRQSYRRASRVIVLDEDMRDYLQKTHGVDSSVIEPFPPEVRWPSQSDDRTEIRRWLYSGNFGRAHEIDVLLRIQKALEDRQLPFELVLQGHGPQFLSSQQAARDLGLRRVLWREPVPLDGLAESLLQSDVLVVTRRVDMKGLLLPSKLILAELSGRSVLWIGDTDGKTAERLARVGRHGVFALVEVEAIADWFQALPERSQGMVAPRATSLARQQAVSQWDELLRS